MSHHIANNQLQTLRNRTIYLTPRVVNFDAHDSVICQINYDQAPNTVRLASLNFDAEMEVTGNVTCV